MDTEREGVGGMSWESRTDIYTLPCVKQIAGGKLLHSTGSPIRCSVITWRGGIGWGGGPRDKENSHS